LFYYNRDKPTGLFKRTQAFSKQIGIKYFPKAKTMKYEEWIKYEEIRQSQPDKFAWIAFPELNTSTLVKTEEQPSSPCQTKKNHWMLLFQRFISRRI
jgi:hypothetical protein